MTTRERLHTSSGQTLMIAIALGSFLLIALTALYFSNQIGTLHQTANAQRTKGQSVADEGIAYAIQQLSVSTTVWHNALGGTFPADCNSAADLVSSSSGHFKLHCSIGTSGNPGLQPYEVAVVSVASTPGGNGAGTTLRAVKAYLSQRTLGADLARNVHAAAALQLAAQPNVAGILDVHWGPIVCLDGNTIGSPSPWKIPDPMDSGRYPRKFSVGGLTANVSTYARSGLTAGSGPNSDQKEYWAYAAQTDVPLTNEAYYIQQAQAASGITQPKSLLTGASIAPTGCSGGSTTCGYFGPPNLAPGDVAVFGDGGVTYAASGGINNAVIYVDGWAQFKKIAIDSATVVVSGQLTVTDATGGAPRTLDVPASAALEYPYTPATPASWPCQGQQGSSCLTAGNVQFHGFLYVKGHLMMNVQGWTMAGALLVGDLQAPLGTMGTLNVPGPGGPANASMTLYYDDRLNHDIVVNPIAGNAIKIVPDQMQDVSGY